MGWGVGGRVGVGDWGWGFTSPGRVGWTALKVVIVDRLHGAKTPKTAVCNRSTMSERGSEWNTPPPQTPPPHTHTHPTTTKQLLPSLLVHIFAQKSQFPVIFSLNSCSQRRLERSRAPRCSSAGEIAAVASLLHKGQFSCFITS